MFTTAVVQLSTGLLADVQSSTSMPRATTARILNAIEEFGGTPADWQVVTLPSGAILNPLARQYAAMEDGAVVEIIQTTPPILSQDAAHVIADGVTQVTFTLDTGEAAYTGPVNWRVTSPDGIVYNEAGAAVDGVDTWAFAITCPGEWLVVASTPAHGTARCALIGLGE